MVQAGPAISEDKWTGAESQVVYHFYYHFADQTGRAEK